MPEKDSDVVMISVRLPKSLHAKVKSAAPLREIDVQQAYQQALSLWLEWPKVAVDFVCRFCRAEYKVRPADPSESTIKKAPPVTQPIPGLPQVSPEAQWMVDEFIRVLNDPNEQSAVQFFSDWLSRRRPRNE